jgi:hypothetical protein
MCIPVDPRIDHRLASLPQAAWRQGEPQSAPVGQGLGGMLREPGVPPTHAYLPTAAIISLLYVTAEGASVEIAVVGNEGIAPLMGGQSRPGRATPQSAGAPAAWMRSP